MFTFKLSPTGGRPTSAGAGAGAAGASAGRASVGAGAGADAGVAGAVDSGDLGDEAWRTAVSYFDLGDVFPCISGIAVNYPELGDLRNSATWGFFATRWSGGMGEDRPRIVAQLGKTGQIRVTDQHSARDGPPPRSRIIGARSLLAHDN